MEEELDEAIQGMKDASSEVCVGPTLIDQA